MNNGGICSWLNTDTNIQQLDIGSCEGACKYHHSSYRSQTMYRCIMVQVACSNADHIQRNDAYSIPLGCTEFCQFQVQNPTKHESVAS